jgi:hypothetical protein
MLLRRINEGVDESNREVCLKLIRNMNSANDSIESMFSGMLKQIYQVVGKDRSISS